MGDWLQTDAINVFVFVLAGVQQIEHFRVMDRFENSVLYFLKGQMPIVKPNFTVGQLAFSPKKRIVQFKTLQ